MHNSTTSVVTSNVAQDCNLVNKYDWPKDIAYKVCMKESHGNINAANWNDKHHNCTGSFSLMQVACFWYPYYGHTANDRYNPEINMDIAYKIWQRGKTFKPWSTCKLVEYCK